LVFTVPVLVTEVTSPHTIFLRAKLSLENVFVLHEPEIPFSHARLPQLLLLSATR